MREPSDFTIDILSDMDETAYVNDFNYQYDGSNFQYDQVACLNDNNDLNLADMELDAEDLTEIYHMVSDWEFNFGSLEGPEGEELLRLVQKENLVAQLCQRPASSSSNQGDQDMHDRLPSYYTALASSRSAPWIPPSSQQVFNKLPAYITDVSSSLPPCEQQPGKKKLNLAEYRNRREQLKQQQVKEEVIEIKTEEIKENDEEKQLQQKVKVEAEASTKSEPSLAAKRSTRSYSSSDDSSRSSRRRSHRSSSRSSYSSRSRSRSPATTSHRSSRRRKSRSSGGSRSSRDRRSRSWRRSRSRSERRSRRRSPSPRYRRSRPAGRQQQHYPRRRRASRGSVERQRQIEERRVIYVGKLADGTSRADLRRRFEVFGPVVDISLHFRERGDNYGFVTFAYKVDAYEAVEHGNDDPHMPKYDLSFGGRRAFCKETYADLDAVDDDGRSRANDVDFETLLRVVKAQLHRRPCS